MPTLQSIFKRTIATLTLFTRLPLWRLCNVDAEHYRHVVPLWSMAGWVTGGVMAGIYYLGQTVGLPIGLCVALALAGRTLLTGALHEDGFADFCDGFGGGTSRESTLRIMKDSHIGTYGVLGLVLYYIIMWNLLTTVIPATGSVMTFIVADCMSKFISSTIVIFLPYARKESEAKIQAVYARPAVMEFLAGSVFGLLPLCLFFSWAFVLSSLAALAAALMLFAYMHRRIGGYTGDCCGATFIITECVMYMAVMVVGFGL